MRGAMNRIPHSGPRMESPQPNLRRQQRLRVRVAAPSHLVVDVEGARYYVTCLPKHDNPTPGGPLRPGQLVRIYNTPDPHGPTLVERITPDGRADGCKYLLRDYDRVAPSASGPSTRGRAPHQAGGSARKRSADRATPRDPR
jgi:hypothetical protein